MPQPHPQQLGIQGAPETYATACNTIGSLTHWRRPGIEPESSQTLCQVLNLVSDNGNSPSSLYYSLFLFPVCVNCVCVHVVCVCVCMFDKITKVQKALSFFTIGLILGPVIYYAFLFWGLIHEKQSPPPPLLLKQPQEIGQRNIVWTWLYIT